jgi:phosphinothricin acetyltransferase
VSDAGIEVRNATTDDARGIASIYEFYVLTTCGTFEETPPGSGEIRTRMAKVAAAGLPWLVANSPDGRLLGYAYASVFHARSAYRFTIEDSVYVDQAHLRRGIATRLMQRLIAECEQRGYRQMIALIGDSANEASIALHTTMRFERAGVLSNVGFKCGRWVDAVLMQRHLGDGSRTFPAAI